MAFVFVCHFVFVYLADLNGPGSHILYKNCCKHTSEERIGSLFLYKICCMDFGEWHNCFFFTVSSPAMEMRSMQTSDSPVLNKYAVVNDAPESAFFHL